ncbi:hypothetical protein FMUND_6119 [Fusarium mundagurra]|uniref:Arrestin-like N-terminal domain-containing protein n=1 Tax=Fusarium mundagurra TaxID=1567541 RepID=A0A8H5YQA2_9HYPO|nr:hypothetical protein FMUND_6119 [Fusarium mundagurra]
MPQTGPSMSSKLGIRLEGNQRSYSPGDTIIGCVYRKSPVIVIHRANNTTTYRGRFDLIPESACSQKIFQGPLHIESGGDEQTWPFAIKLPKHVDPRYLQGGGQDESFVPLGATDHVLPSTYTLRALGNTEGFVEYFLKATLRVTRKGHIDMTEAVLPFNIINLSPDPPIADFGLKGSRSRQTISSYRLVPGMEDVKLSFSQKVKQSFSASSVPEFVYNLLVDVPSVIQLENPTPIPFKLRVVPDSNGTSEIIKQVPQKIKLLSVSMRIASSTEVICEGSLYPHTKERREEIDLCVESAINRIQDDIYIPCTDEGPPLDIGAILGLRLEQSRPGSLHRPSSLPKLNPTFTTYNIRHSHRLTWKVIGEIAGERFSALGAVPLKIVMPSDGRGWLGEQDSAQRTETEGTFDGAPDKGEEYQALLKFCGISVDDPQRLEKLRAVPTAKIIEAASSINKAAFSPLADKSSFPIIPNYLNHANIISDCSWINAIVRGDAVFEGYLFAHNLMDVRPEAFCQHVENLLGAENAERVLKEYKISRTMDGNLFWTRLCTLCGDVMFSLPCHTLSKELWQSGKKQYRCILSLCNPFPGSFVSNILGLHFIELTYQFMTFMERLTLQRQRDVCIGFVRRWTAFAYGEEALVSVYMGR